MDELTQENDVLLVFQRSGTGAPAPGAPPPSAAAPVMRDMGGVTEEVAVRVHEIADWFKDFEIDQIEVSISGCVQSGSVLKLLVDAQGQGGVTVTLKPKKNPAGPSTS